MHNNLRITRILKSLGELGFEHFQAPLVRFFLEETLVRKTLSSVKRSVLDYFLFAVRDKRERRKLVRFAFQHFEPKDKFVWCPRRIQKRFKKKSEKRQNSGSGDSAAMDEGHSRDSNKDGEPKHSKPAAELSDAMKQVDSVMRDDAEKLSEGSSEDQEPDAASVELALSNGTGVNNGELVSGETSKQVTQKSEQAAESSDASCEHADCADSRDETDPADSQEEPEGASEDRTVTDSPKHKEKLPRPGLTMTSVQKDCTQSNGSEKEEPMDTSSNPAHE